jgi:hypothetical protein
MTTIACRNGVMAADSRMTINGRMSTCVKIFKRDGDVLGLAGDDAPALLFLDWYGSGKPRPSILVDGNADFYVLVLDKQKRMWLYDKWCRGEHITARYYAIGTGADAAMAAMRAGASAKRAVAIACTIDINSGLPVKCMRPHKP